MSTDDSDRTYTEDDQGRWREVNGITRHTLAQIAVHLDGPTFTIRWDVVETHELTFPAGQLARLLSCTVADVLANGEDFDTHRLGDALGTVADDDSANSFVNRTVRIHEIRRND